MPAGSGRRIGEALALNVEDIDFEHSEITVSHHMVNTERLEGTKAHPDQVRYLTITPQALKALQTQASNSGPVLS
ncbi:hypothetical protein ACLD0U_07300 [Microbacterium sp. 2216-1]|uniref:hypothetical protein n=1 Tax=Microbacterium sp. 2216-1 TaxID=3390053 RepID=UPI003975C9CE